MFYVTGDTHIPIDIRKLNAKRFPRQQALTKSDYVIICGDFGGVWAADNNSDRYWLDWLEKKNFTTLFVDGNHENHDLLDAMQVEVWCGGKVHFVRPSVIHLMRGQVFTIDGTRFFTLGGAASHDKAWRKPGKSWWPRELPSRDEYEEAVANLEKVGNRVDYIITHTAPMDVARGFYEPADDELELSRFLLWVDETVQFRYWFFGHVHEDCAVDEKHTAVYHKLVQIS